MWWLYLDESGDLGFDFVNKKPSEFFTICIVATGHGETNRAFTTAVKKSEWFDIFKDKIRYEEQYL